MRNSRSEEKMYALKDAALLRAQRIFANKGKAKGESEQYAIEYFYRDALPILDEIYVQVNGEFKSLKDLAQVSETAEQFITEENKEKVKTALKQAGFDDSDITRLENLYGGNQSTFAFQNSLSTDSVASVIMLGTIPLKFDDQREATGAKRKIILFKETNGDVEIRVKSNDALVFPETPGQFLPLGNFDYKLISRSDKSEELSYFKCDNKTFFQLVSKKLTSEYSADVNVDLSNEDTSDFIKNLILEAQENDPEFVAPQNIFNQLTDFCKDNNISVDLASIRLAKDFVANITDQCETVDKKTYEKFRQQKLMNKADSEQLLIIQAYVKKYPDSKIALGYKRAVYKIYKTQELSKNNLLYSSQQNKLTKLATHLSLTPEVFSETQIQFSETEVRQFEETLKNSQRSESGEQVPSSAAEDISRDLWNYFANDLSFAKFLCELKESEFLKLTKLLEKKHQAIDAFEKLSSQKKEQLKLLGVEDFFRDIEFYTSTGRKIALVVADILNVSYRNELASEIRKNPTILHRWMQTGLKLDENTQVQELLDAFNQKVGSLAANEFFLELMFFLGTKNLGLEDKHASISFYQEDGETKLKIISSKVITDKSKLTPDGGYQQIAEIGRLTYVVRFDPHTKRYVLDDKHPPICNEPTFRGILTGDIEIPSKEQIQFVYRMAKESILNSTGSNQEKVKALREAYSPLKNKLPRNEKAAFKFDLSGMDLEGVEFHKGVYTTDPSEANKPSAADVVLFGVKLNDKLAKFFLDELKVQGQLWGSIEGANVSGCDFSKGGYVSDEPFNFNKKTLTSITLDNFTYFTDKHTQTNAATPVSSSTLPTQAGTVVPAPKKAKEANFNGVKCDTKKPMTYEIRTISPTQADYPRGYGSVASASSKQLIASLQIIPENFYKDFRKILKTLKLNAATRAFIKELDRGIFSYDHSMGERFLLMLQHVELNETVKQAFNQTYYNFYKTECAKKLNAYTTIDADKRAIVESLLNLAKQFSPDKKFKIPADLSGLNLSGADLKNLDLSHARLKNANLKRAELTSTDQKVDLPVKNDAYPNLQATLSVGIKELYEKVHSNYNEKLKTRSFLKKIGDFFSFNRHQFFENLEKENLSADEKMDRVRKQASNKPNSLTRAALSDSTGELAKQYKFKVEAKDINASNIQLLLKWMSEEKSSLKFLNIALSMGQQKQNFSGIKLTREQVECIVANKNLPGVTDLLIGADLSGVDLCGVVFSYPKEDVYFNLSNVKVDKNTKVDSEEQLYSTGFPVEQFSVLGFGADESTSLMFEPSAISLQPESSRTFVVQQPQQTPVAAPTPQVTTTPPPAPTTPPAASPIPEPQEADLVNPDSPLGIEHLAMLGSRYVGLNEPINYQGSSHIYAGVVGIEKKRASNEYIFMAAHDNDDPMLRNFSTELKKCLETSINAKTTFDFFLYDDARSGGHFTMLSVTVDPTTQKITIENSDPKYHAPNDRLATLGLAKKEALIKAVTAAALPQQFSAYGINYVYKQALYPQQAAADCGDAAFKALYDTHVSEAKNRDGFNHAALYKANSAHDVRAEILLMYKKAVAEREKASLEISARPRANSAPVYGTLLEQAFPESEDEAAEALRTASSTEELSPRAQSTTPNEELEVVAKVTQTNAPQPAATSASKALPAQQTTTSPPSTTELPAPAAALSPAPEEATPSAVVPVDFHASFAGAITYFKDDHDGKNAIDTLLNPEKKYRVAWIGYREKYHQAPITSGQQSDAYLAVCFENNDQTAGKEDISITANQLGHDKIQWAIETRTNGSRIDEKIAAILLAKISLKTRELQYPAGNASNIKFKEVCLGDDEIHMVDAHLDAGFEKVVCNGKAYDQKKRVPESKSSLTGRRSPAMFSSPSPHDDGNDGPPSSTPGPS